jgi:hypothetical protein
MRLRPADAVPAHDAVDRVGEPEPRQSSSTSSRPPQRVRHENDAQALALAPARIGRAIGQRRETTQRHGAERLDLVEIDVVERDPPPAEPALDDRERLLAPGEIVVRGLVVACRESSYQSRSP